MRGTIFGSIFNILIIIFIFRLIVAAIKKSKQTAQMDKPSDRDNRHASQPPQSPKPLVRNIRFERHEDISPERVLKRCPNCGGEIPLSMMKCGICGTRQPGCSAPLIIFIVFFVFLFTVLFIQGNGFQVLEYVKELAVKLIR